MSKRKQHAPAFKAKVALEALKGEQTAGLRPSSWCKFRDGHCGSSVRRPVLIG